MRNTFLVLTFLFTTSLFAQTPNKMSYQSVIRDVSGNLITNRTISLQVSILQNSSSGTVIFSEKFNPSTNDNGLISLEIGTGTVGIGAFNSIDWSTGVYFIKTEVDPLGGSAYSITGISQILSVPYAKYADKSAEATNAQTLIYTTSGF